MAKGVTSDATIPTPATPLSSHVLTPTAPTVVAAFGKLAAQVAPLSLLASSLPGHRCTRYTVVLAPESKYIIFRMHVRRGSCRPLPE